MADVVFLDEYNGGLEENAEGDGGEELSDMGICEEEGEEANDCNSDELAVNPDELLPPIARLEKYADSDIVFNRQVVARSLLDTLRSVVTNKDEVETVFNIVRKLSDDAEPNVRTELMEQVPQIAAFCWEQNGYLKDIITNHLVPIIIKYLTDVNNQVRKAAQGSLLMMLEQNLVDKGQLEKEICPLILQLTEADNMDDHRTEAVVLMSKVAPLVGKEMTDRLFLHRFSALCQDGSFHVRKVCASNFGDFCSVVGQESTETLLLPKFYSLCEDSVWGVRKSCAEVFMPVSCVCSMEIRRNDLAPFFVNLLCDPSRWVKTSAFQALGPFISTFADPSKTGLCCSEEGIKVLQEDKEEDHKYLDLEQQDERASLCSNLFEEEPPLPQCIFNGGVTEDRGQIYTDVVKNNLVQDDMDLAEDPLGDTNNVINEMSLEERRAHRYATQHNLFHIGQCTNSNTNTTTIGSNTNEENGDTSVFSNLQLNNLNSNYFVEISEPKSETTLVENVVTIPVVSESSLETEPVIELPSQQQNASSMNPIVENYDNDDDEEVVQFELLPSVDISKLQSERCRSNSSGNSESFTVSATDGHIRVHLDNESAFNNFQYWRVPLPELEVDVDIEEGRATSIHVRARVPSTDGAQVYTTDMGIECLIVNKNSNENNGKQRAANYNSQLDSVLTEFQNSSLNELPKNSVDGMRQTQVQTECYAKVFDRSDTRKAVHNLDSSFNEACLTFIHGELSGIKKNHSVRYDNNMLYPNPQVSMNMFMGKARLSPQDQDIIPPELLEHYLSMTDASRAHMIDAEIARHCAYSLPAVALTLGRKFWPCIRETFEVLASDLQWKVRRTLASSIHELAIILGSDLAAQDLLPIFVGFLRDLDEVRIGILQHLSIFLKLLRPSERRDFLPQVGDFLKLDNDKNWRFRLALGEQLTLMADIYSPADVRKYLVPLALALGKDRVCEVRHLSLKVMAVMLRRIGQSQFTNLLTDLLAQLAEQFTLANKWSVRQTFAFLCEHLIQEKSMPLEQFAKDVLPHLLDLGWDCVASVRLAVARCLSQSLLNLDYFASGDNPHQEQLLEVLDRLQKDADRDVRFFAYRSAVYQDLQEELFNNSEVKVNTAYSMVTL